MASFSARILFLAGLWCVVGGSALALTTFASADDRLAGMVPIERQDFGVPLPAGLHAGPMHGPTPTALPGGQVITTQGLAALYRQREAPFIVIDVLGGAQGLPGALPGVWLAEPGRFDDALQRRAETWLGEQTQGRKAVALVFYCQSRECWMSWNAAMRAVRAGYRNTLWYRGGIEAWQAAGLQLQPLGQGGPALASGFTPVQPVAAVSPPGALTIHRGRFFSFALPPGWRVGEDGQFAVTLFAPDASAMTLLVGNAGMPLQARADQYAVRMLSATNPRDLRLGSPTPVQPLPGFSQAVAFDVSLVSSEGRPHRGWVKVSSAPGYDSTVMVISGAIARADQWPGYATWLPMVAEQAQATDGNAFGRRGVMQQNLRNSIEFGEAARRYREWSQRNWQQVTDERGRSADRRAAERRDVLGAVQPWANPFGGQEPVELSTRHRHYWVNRQGEHVGTDDPGADPNVGSTDEWRRMVPVQR